MYINRIDLESINPLGLSIFHKEFLITPINGESIFKCTDHIWTNYKNGKTVYN